MAVDDYVPMQRYNKALRLYDDEKYAECLAECLWCLDNGPSHSPNFAATSLSFVLGLIASVVDECTDAVQELEYRRDGLERRWSAGAPDALCVQTLFAINDVLGKQERSFALLVRGLASGSMAPKDIGAHCRIIRRYVQKTALSRAGTPSDLALQEARSLAIAIVGRTEAFIADRQTTVTVLEFLSAVRDELLSAGKVDSGQELQRLVQRLVTFDSTRSTDPGLGGLPK